MRCLLPCLLLSAPAFAASPAPPPIVAATALDPAGGAVMVELVVTNPDVEARTIPVAPTIDAALDTPGGIHEQVRLARAADQPDTITLPASGFARVHYRFALPGGTGAGLLALTLPGAQAVAITVPGTSTQLAQAAPSAPAAEPTFTRPTAEERGRSGFLANLSSYEPIYAVYAPGTNSDGRLQISLKYQFFGTGGERHSWLDGIMFGYTQQMFWDLGHDSAPFRDVNYMPELYYALPQLAAIGGWTIGGRFGFRHQSNGRSGTASRSFNTIYAEPELNTKLGRYDVAFGPRVWAYVGSRQGNEDVAHYRGNTGLFVLIGTPDGLQLNASGRLNPGSGKGAAEALLSYPLTRLWGSGPKLYLFGQAFAGYGEDLLDYDRHQTRLRAGIGITR